MAFKIGTITSADTAYRGTYASQKFLDFVRQFASGCGTIGSVTTGGGNVGNGTVTGVEGSPNNVTETFTLTCTVGGPTATFSVVGSVSGAAANATVGSLYTGGPVRFTLNDGAIDFDVGDTFTIPVTESTNPTASRWEIIRYDTTLANRELILRGKGYSGTEQIYVGFRSYEDTVGDYYNLTCAVMTGYVPGNTFSNQPGYSAKSFCAHNINIGYWLQVSPIKIMGALKVGTPVYDHFYAGKILGYGNPTQYPYPVVSAGTIGSDLAATRYSDTTRSFPWTGNSSRLTLYTPGGVWVQPHCWPEGQIAGSTPTLADTNGVYVPIPQVLHNNNGTIYGQLEDVYRITGFNNVVENTLTIGGDLLVVIQDIYRTGFNNYVAMRMK